jgi:hypothetical protein
VIGPCARHPEPLTVGGGSLCGMCGATSAPAKAPTFAFRPAAKTIHGELFAIRRFAFAFSPHLA